MAPRAVIFDFGGVLCFHPTPEKIAAAAKACGLPVPEFERAFWANRLNYDAGKLDGPAYWRDIAAATGRQFDDALIAEMIGHEIAFWDNFDTRVIDWACELREQGTRIGILSNLPGPLGRHLRATAGFLKHFDHLTFSYELNMTKPDAAIYEDAIRGLGIEPQEALFIDDRQENIDGARAVGLQTELYVSWEQFRETAGYGRSAPARRQ